MQQQCRLCVCVMYVHMDGVWRVAAVHCITQRSAVIWRSSSSPPYSLLGPIEQHFGKVNGFIRREWYAQDTKGLSFGRFLKWCINQGGKSVKAQATSAILGLL